VRKTPSALRDPLDAQSLHKLLAKALKPPKLSSNFDARLSATLTKRANSQGGTSALVGRPRNAVPFFRLLAVALRLMVIVAMLVWMSSAADSQRTYVTGIGKQATFVLEEHPESRVTLNTDSSLRITREGTDLHVELFKGEALFDVRPHSGRKLVITFKDTKVIDDSTVFTTRVMDDDRLEVIVEEGQVEVFTSQDHGSYVEPTQVREHTRAVVAYSQQQQAVRTYSLTSEEIQDHLSWRHGDLVFHCASIAYVIRELNRYNRTKIQLVGDDGTLYPVGGIFSAADPWAFASTMALVFPDLLAVRSRATDGSPLLMLIHRKSAHRRAAIRAFPNCVRDTGDRDN